MTSSPMTVRIAGSSLQMGALTVTFHRTLRIPDNGRNTSMRALFDDLAIAVLAAPDEIVQDVDTWADLARAQGEAP